MRCQQESGQSQFAPLKLRSLALVPSYGAQSAPTSSTYGSSTARLFPPRQGALVRDLQPFRAAHRAYKEKGPEAKLGRTFFSMHLIGFQKYKTCILSDFKKSFSALYRNLDIFTTFVSTI